MYRAISRMLPATILGLLFAAQVAVAAPALQAVDIQKPGHGMTLDLPNIQKPGHNLQLSDPQNIQKPGHGMVMDGPANIQKPGHNS